MLPHFLAHCTVVTNHQASGLKFQIFRPQVPKTSDLEIFISTWLPPTPWESYASMSTDKFWGFWGQSARAAAWPCRAVALYWLCALFLPWTTTGKTPERWTFWWILIVLFTVANQGPWWHMTGIWLAYDAYDGLFPKWYRRKNYKSNCSTRSGSWYPESDDDIHRWLVGWNADRISTWYMHDS